jgi:hypothetical protein
MAPASTADVDRGGEVDNNVFRTDKEDFVLD